MSDAAAWIVAIAALLSLFVSIAALSASRNAMKASEGMARLDQKIELSLSRFKDDLAKDKVFAKEEVTDLRLKGVDNSLRDLNHRTSRNTEQISMILQTLLQSGVMKMKGSDSEDRHTG